LGQHHRGCGNDDFQNASHENTLSVLLSEALAPWSLPILWSAFFRIGRSCRNAETAEALAYDC
jgi:hypothetical protein